MRIKEKAVCFCMIAALILSFGLCSVPMRAADALSILINGEALVTDPAPVIINGRTLVPLRAIFEAIDAEVEWDGETATVTGHKDETFITLVIGQKQAMRNGEAIPLDVPATILAGRTMVPLRFISEAFGAAVSYDPETSTVTIITETKPQPDNISVQAYGIQSITTPVARSHMAEVTFKGTPLTIYHITVTYTSGESKAAGLEDKATDENGLASWTWKIGGNTTPGTYTISIAAGERIFTGYFTVTE